METLKERIKKLMDSPLRDMEDRYEHFLHGPNELCPVIHHFKPHD